MTRTMDSEAHRSLTRHTSVRDFRKFYWLKTELQDFCRVHGISRCASARAC
jgi:SAP domain-containing new25